MPKEVKDIIRTKANALGMTITAYVETLVLADHENELLTKKNLKDVTGRLDKRA